MDTIDKDLLEFLAEFVTEERKTLIENVLNKRTRYITVVLEDIYQSQNASAVLRTCDCFGIQDVHVIENTNTYQINPRVVHGSSKWISLTRYDEEADNTARALSVLRDKGYTLVGTVPDQEAMDIHDYTFEGPTALVFGTEATGLSPTALSMCDATVSYPMTGFTESLNLSVCSSLCLSVALRNLNKQEIDWSLSSFEKDELRLEWYRYSVSRNEVIEREFRKKNK